MPATPESVIAKNMQAAKISAKTSAMPERMSRQPNTRPKRFHTSWKLRLTAAKFLMGFIYRNGVNEQQKGGAGKLCNEHEKKDKNERHNEACAGMEHASVEKGRN